MIKGEFNYKDNKTITNDKLIGRKQKNTLFSERVFNNKLKSKLIF